MTLTLKPLVAAAAALFFSAASHGFAAIAPQATVADNISQPTPGAWHYGYTLSNTTFCIGGCGDTIQGLPVVGYWLTVSSFSVPYFSDAGINGVVSPAGWSSSILATDSFGLAGASTLSWTADSSASALAVGASLSGFGYDAAYGAGKGPFAVELTMAGMRFTGDPAVPLSPLAAQAGLLPLAAVPEPASLALLLAGLGVLGWRARRR